MFISLMVVMIVVIGKNELTHVYDSFAMLIHVICLSLQSTAGVKLQKQPITQRLILVVKFEGLTSSFKRQKVDL